RALAAIAGTCRDLFITTLADTADPIFADPHALPHDLSLFHRTVRAYRRLYFTLNENNIAVDEPVRLDEPRRFVSPALSAIEAAMAHETPGAGSAAAAAASDDSVMLLESPSRRIETDAAAMCIRHLLREGYR